MHNANQIITDDQIDSVWGNSDFGTRTPREVVDDTMFKCAGGYRTGHTAQQIAIELGLVTRNWTITELGHRYLCAIISDVKDKADKWDALEEKIGKYYAEPEDEDYDKDMDESGLIGIGETAARAFGFL